jgi:hypothetical protein
MRIKLKPADKLFSTLIRDRDNWDCQRCGKRYEPPTTALQNSHFWGRGNKATRFDPLNCDALCYGCHARWEGNKQGEYRDFKLRQLGKQKYDELQKRAYSTIKFGEHEFKEMHEFLKKNGLQGLDEYVAQLH